VNRIRIILNVLRRLTVARHELQEPHNQELAQNEPRELHNQEFEQARALEIANQRVL